MIDLEPARNCVFFLQEQREKEIEEIEEYFEDDNDRDELIENILLYGQFYQKFHCVDQPYHLQEQLLDIQQKLNTQDSKVIHRAERELKDLIKAIRSSKKAAKQNIEYLNGELSFYDEILSTCQQIMS